MVLKQKQCSFSVCGEGLTRLVRDMYCYEFKQFQALNILESLEGITISQAKKVCTGQARLEDRNNDGLIYFINEPDPEFVSAYAEHQVWLEKHLEDEARELKNLVTNLNTPRSVMMDAEEAVAMGKRIARGELDLINKGYCLERDSLEGGRHERSSYGSDHMDNVAKSGLLGSALRKAYPDAYEDEEPELPSLEAMTFRDPVIPEPSRETVKVGKWDVPKNLIDRYAMHVVKRIRKSIREGEIPNSVDGVTELYNLEIERQGLHDAICAALGFDHDAEHGKRSEEQEDFDNALQDYLDKHAGSLFNGGDD